MNSILYINKPKGLTSFDVCFKLRKVLNTKKIGHTGTLDPNANGVMVIVYDKATKTVPFLVADNKEYIAKVKYGIETDTLDITGKVIKENNNYTIPTKEQLIYVLNSFKGKSKQIVPSTSAKKINGIKLYEYQRKGIDIELPTIDIEIFNIELLSFDEKGFEFKTTVSSGTYIRSLVKDILSKLNVIGTLEELCRSKINDITIDDCDDLQDVLNGNYHNHDLYQILSYRYKTIEINNIDNIKNGKRIKLDCEDEFVFLHNNKEPLAIYQKDNGEYKNVRGLW